MLQDAQAPSHAAEWGATIQRTVKQRAAVQREVGRLLDALAPERPPARHDVPVPTVRQHRAPGRCILQSDSHAVTVSWFPARSDAEALGEVVVISWRGTVAHPGGAARASTGHAEAMQTITLQPVEGDDGEWTWQSDRGAPYDTQALATYCRSLLGQ